MQELYKNKKHNNSEDEIDILELFHVLIQGRWIIISLTSLVSIIGVVYSLYLPNIYESKALLVPVDSSSSISGALQNYSGLAGLAGISLPSANPKSNSIKAIETIGSLSFFENNLMPQIFLPDLMAVKSWNFNTKTLAYDDSIYNENSSTWVRDSSYQAKQKPSAQESFAVFKSKHLNISEDKLNGFITLKIRHQSPFLAKKWAELIVEEVNSFYRKKDKSESERAVIYLNQQISKTSLSEIKQVIAELLQQETQKLTLIESNKSYVFEYIDPPAVMEKKLEPQRSTICILFALLGGMLSILIVLIKHYVDREKASLA